MMNFNSDATDKILDNVMKKSSSSYVRANIPTEQAMDSNTDEKMEKMKSEGVLMWIKH